jgi:hypothetical protein
MSHHPAGRMPLPRRHQARSRNVTSDHPAQLKGGSLNAYLSLGTAVTERTPGRNFMLVRVGRGVDNLPAYEIASSTADNSCVAAGFGGEIVYHSCSNGDQVVWDMVISSKGNTEWLDNALASSGPQTRWFLGGNNNGTQFRLSQEGDGGFIQFNK